MVVEIGDAPWGDRYGPAVWPSVDDVGPPDGESTRTFGERLIRRHRRALRGLLCSARTTRIVAGVGPFAESPKSPIRITV